MEFLPRGEGLAMEGTEHGFVKHENYKYLFNCTIQSINIFYAKITVWLFAINEYAFKIYFYFYQIKKYENYKAFIIIYIL